MTENNNSKMPIIMIGHSFKYETEATLKLFFNTARFSFTSDIAEASDCDYVLTEVAEANSVTVRVCLNGVKAEKTAKLPPDAEKKDFEYTICRLLFELLVSKTGITPP
jgi:oxygen-independent coproporphyrinogen-3 oxidase